MNTNQSESWLDVFNEYWEKRKYFGIPVDYEMTEEEEETFHISEEAVWEWVKDKKFNSGS